MSGDLNNFCAVCGGEFDGGLDCLRSTLKNQRFGATVDSAGDIIRESCERCQREMEEDLEDNW